MKLRQIKIEHFKSKKEVCDYIKNKFKSAKLIFLKGSSIYKVTDNFSDFDFEAYFDFDKEKLPHYEIILFNEKIMLISVYLYPFVKGRKIKSPDDILLVKGFYNDKIIPSFDKGAWNQEEKIIRESQLVIDCLFKYIISKDLRYLYYVQKRLIK